MRRALFTVVTNSVKVEWKHYFSNGKKLDSIYVYPTDGFYDEFHISFDDKINKYERKTVSGQRVRESNKNAAGNQNLFL